MGKAPSAPNPVTTAQAQTASNRETAITQNQLNMVNQTDALGNKLSYAQEGTWADGTPKYTSQQTLSAPQQAIANAGQATQGNLANLAKEQSGRLSGLLNQPLDWAAQQEYLNNLTAQNLDPQWDRMAERNEQALVNRGLRPGSTAYNNAVDQFSQSRSSAYNNANLGNYNNALQSQLALRAQPLNEILALSGQSQVQSPQFGQTPQTGVAGTDIAGITNANYAQQMQGYNAGQQQLGGLFSAGASLIPLLSDRRMKTDIKAVGKLDNGLTVYLYRYIGDDTFQIGLMADEVKAVAPEAVERGPDGFDRVFYKKAVA
jgi:hypothetical protein